MLLSVSCRTGRLQSKSTKGNFLGDITGLLKRRGNTTRALESPAVYDSIPNTMAQSAVTVRLNLVTKKLRTVTQRVYQMYIERKEL